VEVKHVTWNECRWYLKTVQKSMFVPMRGDVTAGWETLHTLYHTRNIRFVKSSRICWQSM